MNEENKINEENKNSSEQSESKQADFDWDKVEIEEEKTDDWEEETEKKDTQKSDKKQRRDFIIEMALFLILGILMGVSIKLEASKRITIGYDDYKMAKYQQQYDINSLQEQARKKAAEEANKQAGQAGESATDSSQPSGGPAPDSSGQNLQQENTGQ